MTFVDLFAGIGGISLGLERAGHECVGQVEIDPYARKVLEKHWPGVPRIADVKDFQGSEFGPFDLLTGGYPCQPFSHAGDRHGTGRLGDRDERHLWPEMLRLVRAIRPAFVLLENVTGHLSLGFGRVLGDLAESGYDAEWQVIPAAAVGAPHLRERVFVLAHASGERLQRRDDLRGIERLGEPRAEPSRSGAEGGARGLPVAPSTGHADRVQRRRHAPCDLRGLPRTAPRRVEWPAEPDVGRVGHGVPHRVDRLRTLGNSVVPQVAEWIGRRLA